MKIEKILCPVDFSDGSKLALRYAIDMAQHFEASITVIHIAPNVTPFSYTSYYDVDDKTDMENLIKNEVPAGFNCKSEIVKGDGEADTICEYAKTNKMDVVVIGTHGQRTAIEAIENALLGSTSQDVIHNAPCPVMVIREPDHGE